MISYLIGLISGTSLDAVDAALVEFEHGRFRRLIASSATPFPDALRARLLALSHEDQLVSLADLASLDRQLAELFAQAALHLIDQTQRSVDVIAAIGSHGQTIFHDPDRVGSSLQIGDPNRIAAITGMPVVADFRRMDMAYQGQGAPLMPAFHHDLFASDTEPRAVLNLGGIANLTLMPDADARKVTGFDSGPASCLMDEWISRHQGHAFDRDGGWAASGKLVAQGLDRCLADPYFQRPPPKSTGRGYFHLSWLATRWPEHETLPPADVQRTLAELTARSVSDAIHRHLPAARRLIVCGGGACNRFLMDRLRQLLVSVAVETSAAYGVTPEDIEAAGFAWLAQRRLAARHGNLPSVTGARQATRLGGVYLP
ncbi:MAG: anhydro-N-acetylmuramic acid kinase [Panacagrimonas sp.]